ncbi:putative Branchpoint-bridging protein [Seiridium cardinale]|uniref:Branchpoint-bridging protein n=1 Tax=Seiridium cardinale TaxID=138064 RepID=A0ABR2XSU7_9PEZI
MPDYRPPPGYINAAPRTGEAPSRRNSTSLAKDFPEVNFIGHILPLHFPITADAQVEVDAAKELIQAVIETAISTPEHAKERKREQLRNLAIVNGTFRDDEGWNNYNGCAQEEAKPSWRQPPWRAIGQQQERQMLLSLLAYGFSQRLEGALD